MNSTSLLTLLFTAVLAVPAAGLAQQRRMSVMNSPIPFRICPKIDLSRVEAHNVLAWAEDNEVIPDDAIFAMKYFATKDGIKERERPRYPLFGTWDGNIYNTAVWEPSQQGWPALLPDDIEWIVRCRSR